MELTLKAEVRTETGKGPARRARAAGRVPAVLYGPALEPVAVFVDGRELTHALHTESGLNVLINLELDAGRRYLTIPKAVQRHPVRGTLLHADFMNIARDVKIRAQVPIHLTGESPGVKQGGVVEHHLWELEIESLPTEVPPALDADVSRLGLGEHLRVFDILPPPGVEILTPPEEIVVSVVEPQMLRVEAAPEEGEAAAPEGEASEGEESSS